MLFVENGDQRSLSLTPQSGHVTRRCARASASRSNLATSHIDVHISLTPQPGHVTDLCARTSASRRHLATSQVDVHVLVPQPHATIWPRHRSMWTYISLTPQPGHVTHRCALTSASRRNLATPQDCVHVPQPHAATWPRHRSMCTYARTSASGVHFC